MNIDGDLTRAQVPQLLPRIDELSGAERLNLSGVAKADSAGIALLLELVRRARSNGRSIIFTDASPQLRQLAHFFGADTALQFE